jgi:parallel beta-helix repeat protein
MSRFGRPLCLSFAVLLCGPALSDAVAQQPACGQVVTQNVRLVQNLRCPDTNGLIVGADGITIDLDGHGIQQGIGSRGPGVAIDDSAGHDGVTVKNGSVGADGTGIRLVGASGTRLIDVSTAAGVFGISIEGGGGNQIVRGDISGFVGIGVSHSDFLRVTDAKVRSTQQGIRFSGSSAVIARNTVPGGISVAGNGNRLTDNVVDGALDAGIRIISGAENVVARNWVVNTRPVISNEDATGDGIHVDAFTAGTVISRNIAVGNGDDGIDLDSAGARLVRNLANGNADLGIVAPPGTQATGNLASGNGNSAQCVGVTCG